MSGDLTSNERGRSGFAAQASIFNDAYLDTWTGRRLLVLRRLGGLPPEIERFLATGAGLPLPEAELCPVLSCTTDAHLSLSPDQRQRLERLKDAVLADCGQPSEAVGRFPLSPERLEELRAIMQAGVPAPSSGPLKGR